MLSQSEISNLKDWLLTEGYLRELEVCAMLKRVGFPWAIISDYYVDRSGPIATPTEIDVVAWTAVPAAGGVASLRLLADVRHGGDKPWVVFTGGSDDGATGDEHLWHSSALGRVLIEQAPQRLDPIRSIFDSRPSTGHAVVTGLRLEGERDSAFDVLTRVVGGALAYERLIGRNPVPTFEICVSAIVLQAPLFMCSLDEQGLPILRPVARATVMWRHNLPGQAVHRIVLLTPPEVEGFAASVVTAAKSWEAVVAELGASALAAHQLTRATQWQVDGLAGDGWVTSEG